MTTVEDKIYYMQEQILEDFFNDLTKKGMSFDGYEVNDRYKLEINYLNAKLSLENTFFTDKINQMLKELSNLCNFFEINCLNQPDALQIDFILDDTTFAQVEVLKFIGKHFSQCEFVKNNQLNFLIGFYGSLLNVDLQSTLQNCIAENLAPLGEVFNQNYLRLFNELSVAFYEAEIE